MPGIPHRSGITQTTNVGDGSNRQPRSRRTGVGLALGIDFFRSRYTDSVVDLGAADLLICYTDGLSETTDATGRQIGDELLDLACGLPVESPMAAGATLLGLVDAFRRGEPARDDETLIVLQRSRVTLDLPLAESEFGRVDLNARRA
jgi:hypothetical protein